MNILWRVILPVFSKFKYLCAFTLSTLAGNLVAGNFDGIDAEIGLEARYFLEEGLAEQDKLQPSLRLELETAYSFDDDDFQLKLFGRYDQQDKERSHFDVREASWTHVGSSWELKAGVSKVFWGVTESRHLVDVINQSDTVENLDGEDKLGQLMTKFSIEQDWGTIDLFWLPYFRERTFAGQDGRFLAFPLIVDTDNAQYESSAEQWHSDFAVRYSHYVGDLDFAISHFSGTSRDPSFKPNGSMTNPKLNPYYAIVDQTGLELQYIYDEWLLKFEGVTNSGTQSAAGVSERYSAAVFGFEFTQVGIFESSADLGWILEYLFDDRKELAPHNLERDVFAGWRYAFNDEDSSEILAGMIYDPKTEEMMYSVEANKRLANDLKLNIEVRAFQGAESGGAKKTVLLRDDDYIQLELVKYF